MARRFEPLDGAHLPRLGGPCRDCVEWQLGLTSPGRPATDDERLALKADWLAATRADHGCVGWVLVVDDAELGHVLYAPPVAVPRVDAFPTAPVGSDAVVLVGLWAASPALYKPLVHRAVKDLRGRDVAGLEAFGGPPAPPGCLGRTRTSGVGGVPCRFPGPLLDRLGFRVVREHPTCARYRLDTASALQVLDHLESGVGEIARALVPRRRSVPALHPTTDGS